MEDRNSWNGIIFQHIKTRGEWLSSLIWRNRLKLEGDIPEDENDDVGADKKMDLDPSDKRVIDWFDERQKNFKKVSEEKTKSSNDDETWEVNGVPHGWSEVRNPEHPTDMTSTAGRGTGDCLLYTSDAADE